MYVIIHIHDNAGAVGETYLAECGEGLALPPTDNLEVVIEPQMFATVESAVFYAEDDLGLGPNYRFKVLPKRDWGHGNHIIR